MEPAKSVPGRRYWVKTMQLSPTWGWEAREGVEAEANNLQKLFRGVTGRPSINLLTTDLNANSGVRRCDQVVSFNSHGYGGGGSGGWSLLAMDVALGSREAFAGVVMLLVLSLLRE